MSEATAVAALLFLGTAFMTWAAFVSRQLMKMSSTQADITATLRETVFLLHGIDERVDKHSERLARLEAHFQLYPDRHA